MSVTGDGTPTSGGYEADCDPESRSGAAGDEVDPGRTSADVVREAREVIPGGAQTGLRAQAYETGPIAFDSASGATVCTVEGTEYTDYHLAFGPVVLGHSDDRVDVAVRDALSRGVLFGAGTTELELEVARRIVDCVPSVDLVNFCNSGTEATYHAIRLARAYTGNDLVVKFEGCYHGWHDYVDVSVYPPADRVGTPTPESAGMLDAAVDSTLVVPFNNPDALRRTVAAHADDVAAVVLEPVPHSVGCLRPTAEFLTALETVRNEFDVPLVFDEVITGFRHSLHGMGSELGVTPDVSCFAKAMGNGYPVAAVGGREDILSQAGGDNTDGVVISGTYSGHPAGLAAASATMRRIEREDVTAALSSLGQRYREGLADIVEDRGILARVIGYRSIFALQFGVSGRPLSYADVCGIDEDAYRSYAAGMRERGHFFSPNPYKRHHLSFAHGEDHLDSYLAAADEVLAGLARDGTIGKNR